MKIKIKTEDGNFWCYHGINEIYYKQKEYDYIFKHLDFDKLDKDWTIHFSNKKIKNWFCKTYIDSCHLENIYNYSPSGYEWIKNNWGNGIFELFVFYSDKQKLKTIVNRVINLELKRKHIIVKENNNENRNKKI